MTSSFTGGYSVKVVNKKDRESFKCVLCLDIIKSATHGCMSHVFCKSCLIEYINRSNNKIKILCPAGCGIYFDGERLHSNNPVDRFINQIECRCPDCQWKGELYDFVQSHALNCDEKKVLCNLCNAFMKKKSLQHHLSKVCPSRIAECKYCEKKMRYDDKVVHEEVCGETEVECSYRKYGCLEKFKRRIANTHNNEKRLIHSSLVIEYYKRENENLKSINSRLNFSVRRLQSSVANFKSKFKRLLLANDSLQEKYVDLRATVLKLQLTNKDLQSKNESLQSKNENLDIENNSLRSANKQLRFQNNCLKSAMNILHNLYSIKKNSVNAK